MAEGYSVSGGCCPLTGHGRDLGTCGAKPWAEGPEPCPGGHSWMPLGKALPLEYQHPASHCWVSPPQIVKAISSGRTLGVPPGLPPLCHPPTLSPPLGTPRTIPFPGPCSTALLGGGCRIHPAAPASGLRLLSSCRWEEGTWRLPGTLRAEQGLCRIPKPSWVPMRLRTGARAGFGSTGLSSAASTGGRGRRGGNPNCPTQAKLQRNTCQGEWTGAR